MLCWQFELLSVASIRLQRLYQDACTSSNQYTWALEGKSLADPSAISASGSSEVLERFEMVGEMTFSAWLQQNVVV